MQQMQQLQHMQLLAQAQHHIHQPAQSGLHMWKNPAIGVCVVFIRGVVQLW